eukprot:m.10397 g.10397  ORF g.10397 m.10397 type:complete len:82 (-) comp6590_c0_seq1:86-331(-)
MKNNNKCKLLTEEILKLLYKKKKYKDIPSQHHTITIYSGCVLCATPSLLPVCYPVAPKPSHSDPYDTVLARRERDTESLAK